MKILSKENKDRINSIIYVLNKVMTVAMLVSTFIFCISDASIKTMIFFSMLTIFSLIESVSDDILKDTEVNTAILYHQIKGLSEDVNSKEKTKGKID